ncbi:MAG TPA: DUF6036 family nucleotidyltransferase [Chthoniobacterales bacterium]|nr:DUF6036 family nucleotidyltransferase [Chthoniobacterales bacterium]
MRHETQASDIRHFMRELGVALRDEGRVYFTGGVSAVLHGWRQMTVDIDLRSEPELAGFFEALHALKEKLQINLELAAPSDFIPELPGWRERSIFIARHGQLDFYHYDFYSQALAKIERGYDRDLDDVRHMIGSGLVSREKLAQCFEQIRPALLRYPAIDPESFVRKVASFITP